MQILQQRLRCYVLQDNAESTLKSLQQAIYFNPEKAKEAAKPDASFDFIREDQRFQGLLKMQGELA